MATLKTIENHFKDMDATAKAANMGTVMYIGWLASSMNVDIGRWDLIKIFGTPDGKNLITDKRQINTIFSNKVEGLKKKQTENAVQVIAAIENMPELVKALEDSFRTVWKNARKEQESQIKQNFDNIDNLNREIAICMARAAEAQKRLSQMVDNLEPVRAVQKELHEVLKEGTWINPVVAENFLWLNTPNNIRLIHKNRAAGIDCELDVGQFAVRIDLRTFELKVFPYKNNIISTTGYRAVYHPHVNSVGSVCWGNANETVSALRRTFSIGKILSLLYVLLASYDSGVPYVTLHALRDAHKKYTRIPTSMKHPEKIKKTVEEDLPKSNDLWEIGDEVEFEMNAANNGYPRYEFNIDSGGRGVWHSGRVVAVNRELFHFTVQDNETGVQYIWPFRGNSRFREDQHSRPGYVRHV